MKRLKIVDSEKCKEKVKEYGPRALYVNVKIGEETIRGITEYNYHPFSDMVIYVLDEDIERAILKLT